VLVEWSRANLRFLDGVVVYRHERIEEYAEARHLRRQQADSDDSGMDSDDDVDSKDEDVFIEGAEDVLSFSELYVLPDRMQLYETWSSSTESAQAVSEKFDQVCFIPLIARRLQC